VPRASSILAPASAKLPSPWPSLIIRAGAGDYARVLAWLEHERAQNAARQAEREEASAKQAEEIRREVESRHAVMADYKEKFPWKVA
jgi:hypothetical protein